MSDFASLSFNRVSEYLMGDLDTNISLSSSMSSKTKVWHTAVCAYHATHMPKC
jgi:hypothetical protein